jgi:lysozyme
MTLRDQLIRDEGDIPHAYQDSLGYWTIGVGRLIDARKGGGLSKEEREFLLDNDIKAKTAELLKAAPWVSKLDEVRQAVLLNMAFNLGVPGLLKFKNTLAMVQSGEYEAASKAMLKSLWAKQVGKRAERLALQMETGIWQ